MNRSSINWYKISISGTIFIGGILIVLGTYFSTISIMQVSTSDILLKLKSNETLSNQEISFLIEKKRLVSNLSSEGTLLQDLALAELAMAKRYGVFSEDGKKLLNYAKQNLEDGLRSSPANSVGWLRLAYINLLSLGASKEVSNAIYMSINTAPYNYRIIHYRLGLAMVSWDYFSKDEKETLFQQMRIAWRWNKKKTIALITSEKSITMFTKALRSSSDDVSEFNKMIAELKF
ncbi:MAG: hypothetical protein O2970_11315 [Proteobacteria bacterium]|nr:hypothetical protein [Pseudomonadota bacterium]